MLGVNFADQADRDMSIAEFGSFLKSYSLTSEEVLAAYRMAIKKEFEYKVYPTLSIIQAGEILDLYQEFKRNDVNRDKAMRHLKSMQQQEKTMSEAEKKKIEDDFNEMIFNEIKETGFSDKAFVFYKTLSAKGKLRNWDREMKQRFFDYVQNKYLAKKKQEAVMSGTLKAFKDAKSIFKRSERGLNEVSMLCQAIFVCNALRRLKSLEEFKREIQ